ncbi:PCYCGC domain-containing protein [Brevibacillus thermoruber]|uniref:PCYCGC domain-containing protein n=1 Tax=Brevibacillus TaxID=55080 RepID=UPI001EE573AD|nr:PCYCGC domain-containing protein [Brevibacillus agri]MCG5254734.1 PCYCGC domain-containing protein [Brevibacillus agri]
MKTLGSWLLCILSTALIAGCAFETAAPSATEQHTQQQRTQLPHGTTGDIQETTASVNDLPSFLDKVDPQVKSIYQIAGLSNDLLQWIPCYCGCGEEAGHKHNGNCFIKEVKDDGSVVWDDHGTRCGTCLEIAFTSAKMLKEGKTVKEIRTFIDETYKSGFAKPTPTPMPS